MSKTKILSVGQYLPKKIIYSDFYDKKFNLQPGTCEKKSGVKYRHIVEDETISQMGAFATIDAAKKINFDLSQIDCIVSACGVMEQLIPCTASLIADKLKLSNVTCFDINSTCLGFVCALDVCSNLIETGRFKNILIVSSDIASVGLDYDDMKSSILFGDGAAAAIITKSDENDSSKIISSKIKTFPEGKDYACIKGGGSGLHSTKINEKNYKDYLFYMDGEKIYALASRHMLNFFNEVLEDAKCNINDIKLLIPHQASLMSMKLMQKKLKLPTQKVLFNIATQGNTIAASIPLGLNRAINEKMIQRGDKIMLLGTSAGLTIGAMIIEY